jgi:hypothetical protein
MVRFFSDKPNSATSDDKANALGISEFSALLL